MNLIRKIVYSFIFHSAAIFILLAMPTFVFSQVRVEKENEKPKLCEEKAKDETRWMTRNLYLNADQYDKVQTINLYYTCLMISLNNLSDKSLINKKKAELLKNKDAEFRAVLSQQQFEQYKTHKEKKIELKSSPFSMHA